jgi:glycosyltransferase involved in cell wall biosynthesis
VSRAAAAPVQQAGVPSPLEGTALFVDVSALLEVAWTGIANVTGQLARELHRRYPRNTFFFVRDKVLDPDALVAAVERAPGGYLEVLLNNGYAELGHVTDFIGRQPRTVGVFPNVKPAHRVFDVELVVLHDLSAMLMPELHELWAADLHTRSMLRDVQSSDLVCCVSEATRQDALTYLRLPPEKSLVSHLGVERPPLPLEVAVRQPFALVLGTIEPRKNLRLVADFLLSRPELAERLAVMFVGRRGWGPAFDQIFGELLKEEAWQDRIVFTDYLGEADKWTLMRAARFAIFPSMFEGFGLPVIECMAAGCPVIASRSSSLVEFELPAPMYFDPFSVADFSRSFRYVDGLSDRERAAIGRALQAQSQKYTWEACVDRILDAIARVHGRGENAAAQSPRIEAQTIEAPVIEVPEIEVPEIEAPKIEEPEVEAPAAEAVAKPAPRKRARAAH